MIRESHAPFKCKTESNLLAEALNYSRRGLSVFPVRRNKKPAVASWKRFQDTRASEDQIRQWFTENAAKGIAIVCGAVSGDLVVRDFDDSDSYHAWTVDHGELARKLPTVETARGFHVYARSPETRTLTFDDGELRSDGSYVVAPPSIHQSGKPYRWIVPLTDPIPEVDLVGVGLVDREDRSNALCSLSSLSHCNDAIRSAIKDTQPDQIGQRHRRIFDFARRLKSMPEFADATVGEAMAVFTVWHNAALPVIGTKEFTESWCDLVHAWDRIVYPFGSIDEAMANLSASTMPKEASHYDDEPTRKLVAVCRELHRLHEHGVFYLSVRNAGNWTGIHHETAARRLRMLAADGIIEVAKGHTTKRATRYRYIASDASKLPRI